MTLLKKNVDLLMTDGAIRLSLILFVDDKPDRIIYDKMNVIVLEINLYDYKTSDTKLLEIPNQNNIRLMLFIV